MTDLPDPLTALDCDLRTYPWMPLDVSRLFTSETWVLGSAEEKVAALTLWGVSWHQVPAGSLPGDERMLAHLSQAGAAWKRVREHALRGWVKCSDGRLYHPVVAQKARESWDNKLAQKQRTEAARKARQVKRDSEVAADEDGSIPPPVSSVTENAADDVADNAAINATASNGTEQNVQEQERKKEDIGLTASPQPKPAADSALIHDERQTDLIEAVTQRGSVTIRTAKVERIGHDIDEAVRLWNATAVQHNLSLVTRMSEKRRRSLLARLRECGGMEGWKVALEKLVANPWNLGQNPSGWTAGIDYLLTESKFIRLMESRPRAVAATPNPAELTGSAMWAAIAERTKGSRA
jgi:hypothetical protein